MERNMHIYMLENELFKLSRESDLMVSPFNRLFIVNIFLFFLINNWSQGEGGRGDSN